MLRTSPLPADTTRKPRGTTPKSCSHKIALDSVPAEPRDDGFALVLGSRTSVFSASSNSQPSLQSSPSDRSCSVAVPGAGRQRDAHRSGYRRGPPEGRSASFPAQELVRPSPISAPPASALRLVLTSGYYSSASHARRAPRSSSPGCRSTSAASSSRRWGTCSRPSRCGGTSSSGCRSYRASRSRRGGRSSSLPLGSLGRQCRPVLSCEPEPLTVASFWATWKSIVQGRSAAVSVARASSSFA